MRTLTDAFNVKVTINVTQDDINNGVIHSCQTCPIALAAMRTLDGVEPFKNLADSTHVQVRMTAIEIVSVIGGKDYFLCASLPDDARDFIQKFDKGKQMQPTKFSPVSLSLNSASGAVQLP